MENELDKCVSALKKYPSYLHCGKGRISERFDVSEEVITQAKQIVRDSQQIEDQVTQYSENDLQKYLDKHGIDPDSVSQVYFKETATGTRFTVSTKNKDKEFNKEKLYEYLKDTEFNLPEGNSNPVNNSIGVLNIFDAHIDKLAYNGGGGLKEMNDNLEYLKGKARVIIDQLLKEKPEHVIFPIGNDFFNTNGSERATKKGTPQQITVHWEDSFQAGINFYRSVIDYLCQYTTVILVDVRGNHDSDKVYYLGQVLKAVYEGHRSVKCMLNRDNRKYVFENNILFGFQHGDIAKRKISKLPNVMAVEQSDNWGKANHRVWILGDIHHRENYTTYSSLEDSGVDIKFLRPATSSDVWHEEQMWTMAKKSISTILYTNEGNQIIENELFI